MYRKADYFNTPDVRSFAASLRVDLRGVGFSQKAYKSRQ